MLVLAHHWQTRGNLETYIAFAPQVVCTIHQPSFDICSLFDDAMLLSGGKMLYNGPWQEAETYMAVAGFGCACLPGST